MSIYLLNMTFVTRNSKEEKGEKKNCCLRVVANLFASSEYFLLVISSSFEMNR